MRRKISILKNNNGYILILTVLVIAAASLAIALGLSKLLIDQIILQADQDDGLKAMASAETCNEDGLEKLRNTWQNYNYSLSIDGNSCTINIATDSLKATLNVVGSSGEYTRNIILTVDRNLEVILWRQM